MLFRSNYIEKYCKDAYNKFKALVAKMNEISPPEPDKPDGSGDKDDSGSTEGTEGTGSTEGTGTTS